ncbi:MAG: nucleoside triphosphate pyrophosphohydrolase [Firmicutes bacterium]|nr:nucleoside triphosphate pyrophosphohydrolase [Bacillota bacterium]
MSVRRKPPRSARRHRRGRPARGAGTDRSTRTDPQGAHFSEGRFSGTGYGRKFERFVALQAKLLDPDGCPWDREQTHRTLRSYLLEEAYEVLEAIDTGDPGRLRDELGDLLLQIVFHAELARRAGQFDIGQVLDGIHDKMVRRHPHVFGRRRAASSAEVLRNWEELKTAERGANAEGAPSLLDGVPRSLPALLEAHQLSQRAARIGFDWDRVEDLVSKLQEEWTELRQVLFAPEGTASERIEEELGDLLFVTVNLVRFLGLDPEAALKKANRKFVARFQEMEKRARQQGRRLSEVPREEMEKLWEESKFVVSGRTV